MPGLRQPQGQQGAHAPRIGSSEKKQPVALPAKAPAPEGQHPMSVMANAMRRHLQDVRAQVEANCDYVGDKFAEEARKIHYGEVDPRGIYGEATDQEHQELIEEGVTGLAIDGNDLKALEAAIRSLLVDAQRRRQMAQAAQAHARATFRWDRHIEHILAAAGPPFSG